MQRAYYENSIEDFLVEDYCDIFGKLLVNDRFQTNEMQKYAWKEEIKILKKHLSKYRNGSILFEYSIPRIGMRVDVVLLLSGVIFLLEFKVGENRYPASAKVQVLDYALDLKYFHEYSAQRYIVPMVISTNAEKCKNIVEFYDDKIANTLSCNSESISENIELILSIIRDKQINKNDFLNSVYKPTPTIIEAAQMLYRNHGVQEISRNDAGAINLRETTKAINEIIDKSKTFHRKSICFITGVPGSGKTLAGLNIANERHNFDISEHAVFLSGNKPLVDVLLEALARDKTKRDGISKSEALRQVKPFIQIIHKFRDEAVISDAPPIEKIAIFDEAQRAWDSENLSKFMRQKKGFPHFNMSEPEFLIKYMDRHDDWSVIICLVGGGQEIYTGEAGIEDWLSVLKNSFSNWDIYLSNKMTDSEYIGNSSIEGLLEGRKYNIVPELHLAVSLRSFRSENLAAFIKALLDYNVDYAKKIYKGLSINYQFVMTRNFERAKKWVREKARGSERYGLLASSGGKRLRAQGIWVPTEINHVGWFLNEATDVDSSYYLEVAASEFKVQGLELDYAIVAWDANLRFESGTLKFYRFMRSQWQTIHKDKSMKYLKNSYRVLLTRARQGIVIYIPKGSKEDPTTSNTMYDSTFNYFKEIGIEEI